MTTHICPTCSKPCVYKEGIMCTIDGCINDSKSTSNSINDFLKLFGSYKDNPFAKAGHESNI